MKKVFTTKRLCRAGVIAANDGYKSVPCCSVWGECEYCSDDVVEHFYNHCDKENLLGFMTAPWDRTDRKSIDNIVLSMQKLAEARAKFVENR